MKKHNVKQSHATTFDVDIAEEFKEIKATLANGLNRLDTKLDGFKAEINAWKVVFDKQLTKLNDNMTSVLRTISDHEYRLTDLEKKSQKFETQKETISELAKFGWWAAKALIGAGIIIGGILGTAGAWRLIFPA